MYILVYAILIVMFTCGFVVRVELCKELCINTQLDFSVLDCLTT